MEPIVVGASDAAEAAFQAYKAARRSHVSRSIADDVALARYRAYFPLATNTECRLSIRMHLAAKRSARQLSPERGRPPSLVLAISH
jgi:hypothetical protein